MELEQIDIAAIKEEIFRETPRQSIADIISARQPDARVTDTLIESYLDRAASKEFTLDEIVSDIRGLNSFETPHAGKLTFVLGDGTNAMISEETFTKVRESINNQDVIEFMRKNKENFLSCIDAVIEEQ